MTASIRKRWFGIAATVVVALALPGCLRSDGGVGAGAAAWSLDGARYSGKSLDISGETSNARATDFSPDGKRMYVVGRGTQNVAEYSLAVPWAVDSATFARELKIQAPAANGIFFNKHNGTDMYVYNRTALLQFRLATAWDVTTAEWVRTKVLACEHARLRRGHDIHFKPDGSWFYVEDRFNQEVYAYALDESWNIESMRWQATLDIAAQHQAVRGIELAPTGTRMWLMDTGRNAVLEYDLDTAWKLESARFNRTFSLDGVSANTRGITWRPDGRAFYVTSTGHGKIYQFAIE